MTGKALRETIGFVGVTLSLLFVGVQVQQSNVQARAAAYQAIGIATAEFHDGHALDPGMSTLWEQSLQADPLQSWSPDEWARWGKVMLGVLRLTETVLLQVEQGVLPPDAMERLGYEDIEDYLRTWPAFACWWPRLGRNVGSALRARIEQASLSTRFDCSGLQSEFWWYDPVVRPTP